MSKAHTQPPTAAKPSHVILLADWGGRLAGTVLKADVDLVAELDVHSVAYREATAHERAIAGLA